MKSFFVEKDGEKLLIRYYPSINFEIIIDKIFNEGAFIKRTFWVTSPNIINIDFDNEEICFCIGELSGGYYCLDKNVFDIKNNIYIEKDLEISGNWFVTYPSKSVMNIIDRLISNDMYIVARDEGIENCVPANELENIIDAFPNSYEVGKYVTSRVAYLLSAYIENVWKYKESYEKYLNKKDCVIKRERSKPLKLLGFEMYKEAIDNLERMLQYAEAYSEKEWQEGISQIICVLYPKYIASFREIGVGTDGRHSKKPDFMMVDSSGFIDLLEIKKPDNQKVVSSSLYRNNYIAGKDLSGAIVQIEKYVYTLNHGGEKQVERIREKIQSSLPEGIEIRVVNPQGILLLGRSNDLSEEQRMDFEIIKRQHKNIVDIMTYDDLLERLKNIVHQIEKE